MRPFSASLNVKKKEKRKIINFGKTAIIKAKKALEEMKHQKDTELFSSIQHRIYTEFVKYKTFNNFYKKDSRINNNVESIKEKRKLARKNAQINNNEKFQNHSALYLLQNKLRRDKILEYENNYKKKDELCKSIREYELAKKMKKYKEYPKDFLLQNLEVIKQQEKLKKEKIKLKLHNKDLYLINLKNKKNEENNMKKIEQERILKERKFRIIELKNEENKLREEIGKKIGKRNEEIDKFKYEKELINEKRININDNYTNKYQYYIGKIDNILFKKNLNKESLNQIKLMVSSEPALSGLGQNLYYHYLK